MNKACIEQDIVEIHGKIEEITPQFNVVLEGEGPTGPPGPPGASDWSQLSGKPFERIGDTLRVQNGTLDINIYETSNPQGGNTLYIGG